LILVPVRAGMAFMLVALPIFVGVVTFCLWLLLKRLDEERWNQMASQESAG
jgi:hypothetical protein